MKKITEGKEQPGLGKAVTDMEVRRFGLDDPKMQADARKAQEDAATTV